MYLNNIAVLVHSQYHTESHSLSQLSSLTNNIKKTKITVINIKFNLLVTVVIITLNLALSALKLIV